MLLTWSYKDRSGASQGVLSRKPCFFEKCLRALATLMAALIAVARIVTGESFMPEENVYENGQTKKIVLELDAR